VGLALSAALLFLGACSAPLRLSSPVDPAGSSQQARGTLRLALAPRMGAGGASAQAAGDGTPAIVEGAGTAALSPQTVVPTLGGAIASYEVTITRSGFDARTEVSSSTSVEFADLDPGTWDVSVRALKSDGQSVVAVGSASVDVQAGTITSPTIPIEPQQQGSGSIDLTVSWPNAADINGVASAELTPIDGSPLDITESPGLDAGGTAWSYAGEHPSGSYILTVRFTRYESSVGADVEVAGVVELVQVYDNLTTGAGEALQLQTGEIGRAPAPPENLSATPNSPDRIDVVWTVPDDTTVEHIELQRREGSAGTFETVSAELPPFTVLDMDEGLDSQTTYYYRVRTVNDFGASAWVPASGDAEISAVTDQLPAPADFQVTAVGGDSVDLRWSDTSSYEAEFEIERTRVSDSTVDVLTAPSDADINLHSFTDSGLAPGTSYSYRVRAVDPGGSSAWTGPVEAKTELFTAGEGNVLPNSPSSADAVHAADMDGDDDLDVLAGIQSFTLADVDLVLLTNDTGSADAFTATDVTTAAQSLSSVYAVDLDADGDQDIVVAENGGGNPGATTWYDNEGAGSFTRSVVSNGTGPRTAHAADIDGDNDIDIVSTDADLGAGTVDWYENDGSESFTAASLDSNLDVPEGVFAADLDADGDTDVVAALNNAGEIRWYENSDGSGSFENGVTVENVSQAQDVYVADIDGDGDNDIVSAGFGGYIGWYEHTGSGSFSTAEVDTAAGSPSSVFAADLDDDGDMDILAATGSGVVWYDNKDGAGDFSSAKPIITGRTGTKDVYAADLDGDGHLDVLSASQNGIVWMENPLID